MLVRMAEAFDLARRYRDFLDAVFGGLAEPSAHGWSGSYGELDLQSLWFAGEFGDQFETTEGRRIVLRDFGVWNHSAGPDFTGCAVDCDGEILRGDIELDPDVRDWERHGHGANDNYERVILHLFTTTPEARVFTRTREHREVIQVQLKPEMLRDAARPRHQAEARLGRCATPLRELDETRVSSMIEAAAQYRLKRKGERLRALEGIHGRAQMVYQSLATTLGYRNNQRAFTVLTQRLPLKMMLKLDEAEREALLFGVSGFLESVRYEDTEPETRKYLRGLWSDWWKQRGSYASWLTDEQRVRWQIAGGRPGNHPQRRLGALGALLNVWRNVFSILQTAKKWNRKVFAEAMLSLTHDYWSWHYTLLAEPPKKAVALIGDTRVQEMLANVVYPLLLPERAELWTEFKDLPALLDNQKVRRASLRLFGEPSPRTRHFQKRIYQQQGLLQIYEDYCLEDDSACAECPFPEKLKEWRQ